MTMLPRTAQRLPLALLKFIAYLYRSVRDFVAHHVRLGLQVRTTRLFQLLRSLFSIRRILRLEDGKNDPVKSLTLEEAEEKHFIHDHSHGPRLPVFSSSPPPSSIISSSTAVCSSPRSEGRLSTLCSIKEEEEEEQLPNGHAEPAKGHDDEKDDGILPRRIQRVLSDPLRRVTNDPEPSSPLGIEEEEEDQTVEPGGIIVPPGHNNQMRGQPKLRPTWPTLLLRYDRNIAIPEEDGEWTIKTMLSASAFEWVDCPADKRKSREGWTMHIHPEGALYHSANIAGLRFTTEANIFDDEVFDHLKAFTRHIPYRVRLLRQDREVSDMTDTEIVFELATDGNWEYYIADHKDRHLFWLDTYRIESELIGGSESFAHFKHKMNYEYYMHLSFFPYGNSLPDDFYNEMRGMITWTLADSLTSLDSLAPYTEQTLERFLAITDRLDASKDTAPAYSIASGARVWAMFEIERYYNFSGAPGARLTRDQSVHKSKRRPPSSLTKFLSLLLFQVPVKRLEMLDKVYVDHQVKQVAFKSLTTKLVDSWQAEVINSAVLLNANVAYLAIPGILDTQKPNTLGIVASLISIVMSLDSVILGLLLTKRLRGFDEKGTPEAAAYLRRWWNPKQGLIKLALMFSLPYAMLMWGAISFVVAIVFMTIKQFEFNIPFIILIIVFGIALTICAWAILQVDSWATFVRGLQFWHYLAREAVPENERHFVAQRISKARRKATAKTVEFVRRRTSTLFGGSVIAKPGGDRSESMPNSSLA